MVGIDEFPHLPLRHGTVLLAVLPRLDDEGTSFPHWATLSPEEIREAVEADTRPHQVAILSRMAKLKYRRLIVACVGTGLAALCLLAADHLAALG
ncbi:Pycsar system effector family protein [Streptomyces sp. QH1-20]|uniref:Pycsar system effector family protein n=1 Tax=Streptomyces sp. QH1-20 TaxID=3240934 RepID=UPI00351219A1